MTRPPLLNHPPPYLDETLASWLWRLALANYLSSPSEILKLLPKTISPGTPTLKQVLVNLREARVFQALGVLSYTSAHTVYRHTLHRFVHALRLPDQPAEWVHLAPNTTVGLLPHRTNRDFYGSPFAWCPVCLTEARYVRLHWHVAPISCCTTHNCWLQETCPSCQAPITELDIVTAHCDQCGFALDTTRVIPVEPDCLVLSLQTTLMSWLYETSPPDLGFPDAPVNVLLRILQGLRYAAQRAGEDWTFHYVPAHIPRPQLDILKQRRLTLYERGALYSTAFRGLLNWPHDFYAFLDAYRQRPTRTSTGLKGELGQMYLKWLPRFWKHEAFAFLQDAVNVYLLHHFPAPQLVGSKRAKTYPELVEKVDYLNLHRASAVFDVAPSALYRLVEVGRLTAYHFDTHTSRIWLARHELERMQRIWQQTLTLVEASNWLGIGKQRIHDLLDAGLIRKAVDFLVAPDPGVAIDRNSVADFIQRLQKQVTLAQPDKKAKAISLVTLCLRLATLGVKLPDILQRILDGHLTAHHPDASVLPLTDLWFSPETAQHAFTAIKDERDWMGMREVQAYLGVGRGVMQYLMDNRYLQPHTVFVRKYFFRRSDVLAFQQRSVAIDTAAQLLNVPTNAVYAFVNNDLLHPIYGPRINGHGHYAFDRDELLTWHEHYLLERDFPLVTSDVARLRRLLRKHGMTYIMRHPRVYLRAAVLNAIAHEDLS
jgi:hypothetical protein